MLPLPSLTWPQNIGTNIKRAWAAKCQLYRSTAGGGGGKGQGASACWSWLQFELFETISLKKCDTISNDDDKKSQQPSRLSLCLSLPHYLTLSFSHTSLLALSLCLCELLAVPGPGPDRCLSAPRGASSVALIAKTGPTADMCVCVCMCVAPPHNKSNNNKGTKCAGVQVEGGGGWEEAASDSAMSLTASSSSSS